MALGFDVIVVGAGSAGCVVASRLAADGRRSVLLLEAGPDPFPAVGTALRDGFGLPRGADWPYDWGYASEPDDAGATNPLRRGRVIGGTSWLTRFAVRGSPADFDRWAASGLAGWAFDDVLPAFVGLETDAEFGEAPWHGATGPLPITRYPDLPRTPIHAAVVEALEAAGFDRVEDHNRPGAVGVGSMPMSSLGGRRVSAADAFLAPDRRSPTLTVRAQGHVESILVDRDRATGVRLVDGAEVRADEVIACAGTYGSPALLLRSGIGPARELRALGIRLVADLPGVGSNLGDHPALEGPAATAPAGTGPILHSLATWRSSGSAATDPPDLLFWIGDPQGDPPTFTIECVLMRPVARGSVRLRSADPADPPRISLPSVTDPLDSGRLLEARSRASELVTASSLRAFALAAPEAGQRSAAARSFLIENTYHIPHVVGTCAMGTSAADGAVVDASGRVHGVERLRVVDASIIPEPPSGFPSLVTMMVADRIASEMTDRLPPI